MPSYLKGLKLHILSFLNIIILIFVLFFNYRYLVNYHLNSHLTLGSLHTLMDLFIIIGINIIILTNVLLVIYVFLGRFVTKFCIIILYIIASAIAYYQNNFGIVINANIIDGIVNTNFTFSAEIVSFELIVKITIMAILACIVLYFIRIKPSTLLNRITLLIIYLSFSAVILIPIYLYHFDHRTKGTLRDQKLASVFINSNPISILFAYRQYQRRDKTLRNLNYSMDNVVPFKLTEQNSDLKIIIVIGEAARRDRFSLNGYHRDTNPRLSNIENIVSFKNANSYSTNTTSSMYAIMNEKNSVRKKTTLNLAIILKSLGFETNMLSLKNYNRVYASWDIDNITTKYDYLSKIPHRILYDNTLVDHLHKNYSDPSKRQVFILHTLGSHAVYTDRYPKEFNVFTPVCKSSKLNECKLQHLYNAYDNTILYTDHILAEIINIAKNDNAILFYLSDHGESLGENGIFTHSMPDAIAPPEQFSIPFIVWTSKKFIKKNPLVLEALAENLNNKISHYNFFHSVLHCIGADNGQDVKKQLSICHIPKS